LRPRLQISSPENTVEIAFDGTVRMPEQAGISGRLRVQIINFLGAADLVPVGENLFVSRDSAQPNSNATGALPSGRLRQGCLEESNVDVDRELRELERLRKQVRAIEMAAQSLPISAQDPLGPSSGGTGLPSHIARAPGSDRH
jgi:flagellar basal body rod protein FlgG